MILCIIKSLSNLTLYKFISSYIFILKRMNELDNLEKLSFIYYIKAKEIRQLNITRAANYIQFCHSITLHKF